MAVMSGESTAQAAASLRALTYRLTSCPPEQLPSIAPRIAASLWSCRHVLSASSEGGKANSDITQAASRFRASLSQLLQARSVEERWAAVVLAKAAVEAGSVEAVNKASGWTKSLTAILKKNDPPTTKVLAIVTLTRIFTLTWDDTNLVREITTPALPGFVQACLATNEKSAASAKLSQTVLEAFAALLARHPTVFRTYEGQLRAMLLKLLSTTSSTETSDRVPTQSCQNAAGRLFVLLHHCAPKQGGPAKFDETLKATVTAAHTSCDHLFRSIDETWRSNAGVEKVAKASIGELRLAGPDAIGLRAWHGLDAAVERLIILLRLLQAHFEVTISESAALRVGSVVDLAKRLLELNTGLRDQTAHFNSEISRNERESLLRAMPGIHVSVLSLIETMVKRLDGVVISTVADTLEALGVVFAADSADETLRHGSYQLTRTILKLVGPTLSKDSVSDLSYIARGCCDDLVSSSSESKERSMDRSGNDSHQRCLLHARDSTDVRDAAWNLLPLFFSKIDQSAFSTKLRTRMEQVAVLTRHKTALVACVLNPAKESRDTALRPSLLPLLARELPDCPEVEALLRPRYPVAGAKTGGQGEDSMISAEEEDGSEDEDDEMEGAVHAGIKSQEADMTAGSAVDDHAGLPMPYHTSAVNSSPMEVFSTAPEQASQADDSQQSSKRPAPDSSSLRESGSKRRRPSPLVAAQLGDESQRMETNMPSAGVANGLAEAQSAAKVTADVKMPVGADKGEDSDSDFEIPPLTMDSDSDLGEAA